MPSSGNRRRDGTTSNDHERRNPAPDQRWTAIGVIVSGILTALSLLWGIHVFNDQTDEANKTAETANKTEFLKQQLQITIEASDTVALLATTADKTTWENSREKFLSLFWGKLNAVEDKPIETEMVKISDMLPTSTPALPMDSSFEQESRKLALLVRELAFHSWGIKLDDLPLPPRAAPTDETGTSNSNSLPAHCVKMGTTDQVCPAGSDRADCWDPATKGHCKPQM